MVSKNLEDFYSRELRKSKCKCVFIPNVIDSLPLKCSQLSDERLVSVGRLSKKKGYLDLLRCKHYESGDAVVIDGSLQHPEIGDIICVFGTGAYCYTMASNYNGQPRPAVIFVKDGKARITTRRETYDDLMARDL